MDILGWNELNSGGAELTLKMTEEEQKFLIEYAINDILKKKLEDMENGAV
jgi:hypothetical protein